MSRHANIPIFIPHLGCPNSCVFCNQRTISGVQSFDPESVVTIIEDSLKTLAGRECEIAFFGGSFTGIDRALMIRLLEIAKSYVDSGFVNGIRCSTRPDYIDEEVLDILKKYGVTTVELGIQSISDDVLRASRRGHTFEDTARACQMIIEYGFELVGQMMIGLPQSNIQIERNTADFIINTGASSARIYPTVVFTDTELRCMAERGEYTPLSITDAICRTALVYERFIDAGVNVIRVGLCASESISDEEMYYAGPNHPALGELVENEIYYNRISKSFSTLGDVRGCDYTVLVPRGSLSKAIGQGRRNKMRLMDEFHLSRLSFEEDDTITAFGHRLVQERK